MTTFEASALNRILELPLADRLEPLVRLAQDAHSARASGQSVDVTGIVTELVALVDEGVGTGHARLGLGDILGRLGDPRLRVPADDAYWIEIPLEDGGTILVGRMMVSTAEFQSWAEQGGLVADEGWSDEGRAWRDHGHPNWADLASNAELAHLVVPNQPVVGVTWFEADAYARAHGCRLLTSEERKWVSRGPERRPYPWGQPFGQGQANTREEGLHQPCALALYRGDATPDGVTDMAGNAGEWLGDEASDDQRLYHPGSWVQPSMASWAKALQMARPSTRSADLGFRLARSR